MINTLKKKNAWLITWEFSREDYYAAINRPRIAAILDIRVSGAFIDRYLPLLYFSETCNSVFDKAFDMTAASVKGHRNLNWKRPRHFLGKFSYGNDPYILARQVKDLIVERVKDSLEIAHWTEVAIHHPDTNKIESPERRVRLESRRRRNKLVEDLSSTII